MSALNIAPLLSLIVGVFLFLFILFRRLGLGSDRRIRYVLATLVFYFTLVSFDYYMTLSESGSNWYFGISYMFYHLVGFLFYYFIALLIKLSIPLKKWVLIVIGITLLRWTFFYPLFENETIDELMIFLDGSAYDEWLFLEYLAVNLLNVFLLFGILSISTGTYSTYP